jgi:hypothetical protein
MVMHYTNEDVVSRRILILAANRTRVCLSVEENIKTEADMQWNKQEAVILLHRAGTHRYVYCHFSLRFNRRGRFMRLEECMQHGEARRDKANYRRGLLCWRISTAATAMAVCQKVFSTARQGAAKHTILVV